LAIAGQYAENRYFGKPCGLMDQIACAHGGIVKIDFADGDAARIETRDADFLRAGYLLGIVNTGGSHADLTDDYASIPREMRSVANALGSEVLRQIDEGEFHASIPALRRDPAISDRAIMRTLHFFAENRRVDQMLVALSEGRYLDYLSLVRESGHSSMRILQNVTPCGAIDEQNLALVATYIEERFAEDSVIRVHGGGFEGSLQFYVSLDRAEGLLEELQRLCGPGSVDILYIRGPGALCLNQAPDN
jgi:galactokinase